MARCRDTNAFATLPMHIAPIATNRTFADDHRMGFSQCLARVCVADGDAQNAFLIHRQAFKRMGTIAFLIGKTARQAVDGAVLFQMPSWLRPAPSDWPHLSSALTPNWNNSSQAGAGLKARRATQPAALGALQQQACPEPA